MTRTPYTRRALGGGIAILLWAAAACSQGADDAGSAVDDDARSAQSVVASAETEPRRTPTHVDSIFPIEEHLRRFREGLAEPERLTGGARSLEALVERFASALAARDTAAFADMLLTPAEFAWLYYPGTRFTAPPYRLAPEILWMQIQNGSSRGLHRLLDRLGGTTLDVRDLRCPPEPLVEGANRTWEACSLEVAPPGGDPAETRLFGSILERDGVFKFVSYTNDF